MPRYFFDLLDHERDVDDDGVELANADDARAQAVVFAGDWLSDHPQMIWDGRRMTVVVRDEADKVLLNVNMAAEDPAEAGR